MSNFADMAYDNYLMHYRTKSSKNGYTTDPDYTPVGERAVAKKVMRDKIDRLAEENRKKHAGITKLVNQTYRGERFQGDFAGMPSSAREAKEKAERASEINRLSKQFWKGDTHGMPSSDMEAMSKATLEAFRRKRDEQEKRDAEINKLSKQAWRGDYAGMPQSVLYAKADAFVERTKRNAARREKAKEYARSVEISKLSKQKSKGDYAGMPSSAREAKENVKIQKREEARARYQKLNMKEEAEARRKREYDPKAIAENEERRKLLNELRSKQKRPETNKFRAEEMKAEAEAKRSNSAYEKYKREKAARENRDRELLLAENRRRQRVAEREKKRSEKLERDNADNEARDKNEREWEDIVNLNKSNSALKSTSGYGTPRGWLEERRKLLTNKGFKRMTGSGKGRKV